MRTARSGRACKSSASEKSAASPPRHTASPCISISVLRGSNLTPEFPAADNTRPQFGSEPAMAVFTSGELAMARAMVSAARSLGAPSTSIVTSFFAPSPSRAIWIASDSSTSVSADSRTFADGLNFETPFASTATMSLVEVSPSTEIRLKETPMALFSAARSTGPGVATASVITIPSVVAMVAAESSPSLWSFPAMLARFIDAERDLGTCKSVSHDRMGGIHESVGPAVPPRASRSAFVTGGSRSSSTPITPVEAGKYPLCGCTPSA